jgi:hypothetical protein
VGRAAGSSAGAVSGVSGVVVGTSALTGHRYSDQPVMLIWELRVGCKNSVQGNP